MAETTNSLDGRAGASDPAHATTGDKPTKANKGALKSLARGHDLHRVGSN